MTFWSAYGRCYRQAWRFVVALPLIALTVVVVEGLQHIVEWMIGMYASPQGARAAADNDWRMAVGYAKVGWLFVLQYWVVRFVASDGSVKAALALDPVALRKFAWVLVYSICVSALTLQGTQLLQAAGMAPRAATFTTLAIALASFPLGTLLVPWVVGAALGDPKASPVSSARRAWGSILWGLAFSLLTMIPLMAAHYGLGLGAIGRPPALATAMLALDAVLVGYLGIMINVALVLVAERMAQRAGEPLSPGRFGRVAADAPAFPGSGMTAG